MNRELEQYIKPGEFTYCSRCGDVCHIGSEDFICMKCRRIFPVEIRLSGAAKTKYDELLRRERKTSELCKYDRELMAESRKLEAEE